ncbi:4-hydroxy-tetrahydrodipicolinate reductase [Thermoanaerobacterium sp. RBIITD]|uniref:4-hydroxy-tetrahydrodipicolinate reductase n=1 Tax=Thermoanaerobacterium sp. RBIITD TaxID=1550240 RepID=UPI000BB67B3B|nr:4-hydroxy-tetrahydrodipicolinate reductase [Thermoanaerobacterium sp. RBIITD]SNX55091.1 dihydrodipicolinate reductase [Thermoanaerobacterium sp. RBIITD]
MLKIIINGCNGKMGKVIAKLASENPEYEVVAGIDQNSTSYDFPVYKSLDEVKEDGDVVIDFSYHTAIPALLKSAVNKKLPVVIATTGLSEEELKSVCDASKSIPIFRSANMSLGINVLLNLVKEAARILSSDYDIEILEMHHNMKKDSPSGTALLIADAINNVLQDKKEYVYGRHSKADARKQNEIGIHALRGGTVVGEHKVIFAGHDELITISHSARSREIFGNGALKAAKFLVGQKPGLYDMESLVKKG